MEWYACYNQSQAKYFHPLKKVELNKLANKTSSIFKHVQWTFKLINALGILSTEGHQGWVATPKFKTQWQKFIIFFPNWHSLLWQEFGVPGIPTSSKWKYFIQLVKITRGGRKLLPNHLTNGNIYSLGTGVPGIVINLTEWTLSEIEAGKVDNHYSVAFKKSIYLE
jgi:hypothetical protein